MSALVEQFWPQSVLDELAERTRQVTLEAYARREMRAIEAEADRIAANPMLLDGINCLFASSKPRTIVAVCEALLEEPGAVGVLRLRGAIAYAQRQLEQAA